MPALKTQQQFIEEAILKHGDKYDYSKVNYTSSKIKIVIICKEHGEFLQQPSLHLKKTGCRKCLGLSSPTTEEFIQKAKLIHGDKYDYSKVNYKNNNTHVTIICKIHGEFYQKPIIHIGKSKSNCSKCKGNYKFTTKDFIEKSRIIHGDKYDYSKVEFENMKSKVIIICKEHGEFTQNASCHSMGKGCRLCYYNLCSKRQTKTLEYFLSKAKETHGEKYDYTKTIYENTEKKVIIICKIHGEFLISPKHHITNKGGCSKCSNNYVPTTDEFIEKAKIIHGDLYDYSKTKYVNSKKKIIIICKIHGEFEQSPTNHTRSKQGCPKCNTLFHISNKQIQWLELLMKLNNIHIQHGKNGNEYKINGTRYKADGYCSETNTIFEFHGDYWHGNPELYLSNSKSHTYKTFGQLYKNTLKKENTIKKLGYNLVVMWENKWNKINKAIKLLQKKFRKNRYK